MKNILIVLILISLFACKAKETEQTEVTEQAPKGCVAADFFELKNQNLEKDFFTKLDNLRQIPFEGGNPTEANTWRDVTNEALQAFLADAAKGGFAESKTFENDYNFDLAPSEGKDSEKCMDKLSVTFDENTCTFNLKIFNSFQYSIDNEDCSESLIDLKFKIEEKKITNFTMDIAG
ncbi:MAG: hypothetical protein HC803_00640 [Saprospiraceae bacterium]|nr:hypothetical protein [Saprospiraceae bacterium]